MTQAKYAKVNKRNKKRPNKEKTHWTKCQP